MIPVEPISLTIGAVALASMFSLCVQCFDLIEVGRNLGADFELLTVKLSIEKRRLMIWGEAVGILRPDETRDAMLDEPNTRPLVERILGNMQKLFTEADVLTTNYGLEDVSGNMRRTPNEDAAVQGSIVCAESFEVSSIVQFQTRFSRNHSKAGFRDRARWAIRDSKTFTTMIQNLKDLVDGLTQITTSARTSLTKGDLIREETDLIEDLQTLQIIENTCSDADWRSSASVSSSYLGQSRAMSPSRLEGIRRWTGADSGLIKPHEQMNGISQHRRSSSAYSVDPSNESLRFVPNTPPAVGEGRGLYMLDCPNQPPAHPQTEILLLSSTTTLKAYVSDEDGFFTSSHSIPMTTIANRTTSSRILRAIHRPPGNATPPCVTIYCPPRRRYLHMALALSERCTDLRFKIHLRFDDRLVDGKLGSEAVLQRMESHHADIVDNLETEDRALYNIIEAVDMNWLEQRLEVISQPGYSRSSQPLEWGTVFRQGKDDSNCIGIIILASLSKAEILLNRAPVLPPDTIRDGRVYRLQVLAGTDSESEYRWKAEHYFNVSEDKPPMSFLHPQQHHELPTRLGANR